MNGRIASLLVVAVVLIAGCSYWSTSTPTSNLEGVVEQHNTVYFTGTTTVSNGSFIMRGEIRGCFGHVGPDNCEDTRVLLYTEKGSLIASEYVGTLTGRRNVSLRTDRIPHYVILTSPDVWGANHTSVGYFFYSDGLYLGRRVGEREELPIDIEMSALTATPSVGRGPAVETGQ